MNAPNAAECSPLVLAYVGDAVYELFVRHNVLKQLSNTQVDKLHKTTASFVKAAAQSDGFYRIEPCLTEQEMAVFKRGRNAKSTVPKNGNMQQYRTATGVEALFGYLYLDNQHERLHELMTLMTQSQTE